MNRPSIASPADLAAGLKAEIEVLHQFIITLQSEQDVLTEGNIDKLLDISRRKSEQVVHLSKLSASLFSSQSNTEVPPEDIAMTLREADPAGNYGLAQSWEKLSELAKQAKHLNQLNGAMIETQLKYNQQALAILQEAAKQNSLYGPDGHSRGLGTGRQLGKS